MLFKDIKPKNVILLALTLVIFFVVIEFSVILYMLLFLPKSMGLTLDKSLLDFTVRNPDQTTRDLKLLDRRFKAKKVHLKLVNVNEDNYFGGSTNFRSRHWDIGGTSLKLFSEDYFSATNIAYLVKKNFMHVDQIPIQLYGSQLCYGNAKLTLSTIPLLSNLMLGSYKIAVCALAILYFSWLVVTSALCLSFSIKYLVLLLQTVAKIVMLIGSIGGVRKQLPIKLPLPIWPACTYVAHWFADCYQYGPLILVEYENHPRWLVHYLLLPKDLKYLEDCKFLNEYSSASTWQGYILYNSLAEVRSHIDRSFFTCPHGNTYQFLIKRDYLNSVIAYLNFSLIPSIPSRIKIKYEKKSIIYESL